MFKILLPVVFCLSALGAIAPAPNPDLTVGTYCTKTDPDFDGLRYPERIAHCRRDVSQELKRKIYQAYGIPARCEHYYTIDHFIPLALGGSNDSANLWPEHKAVKATRRDLEEHLYRALVRAEMTQKDAVGTIVYEKTHAPAIKVPECQ